MSILINNLAVDSKVKHYIDINVRYAKRIATLWGSRIIGELWLYHSLIIHANLTPKNPRSVYTSPENMYIQLNIILTICSRIL